MEEILDEMVRREAIKTKNISGKKVWTYEGA
jgi:hypothetical protein